MPWQQDRLELLGARVTIMLGVHELSELLGSDMLVVWHTWDWLNG